MPETQITRKNTVFYPGHAPESGMNLLYTGEVVYLPNGNIDRHTHGHYELSLFTEGIVDATVGDASYALRPGDLLLTKPGDLHSVTSRGTDWGKLYIGVDRISPDELGNTFRYSDKRLFPRSDALEWIFRRLLAEVEEHHFCMPTAVNGLLELLLVAVAREIHPQRISNEISVPKPVALARMYIESHLYHDLDLSVVAEYSCLSKSRLSHIFVHETGLTLKNYLKYVIMHRALRLLEDDRKSISEIAQEFRYPSVQYFSTVFRKFWCYTPSDYRNWVRKHIPYQP